MSKLLVDEIGGNAAAATTIASGKNITGTASQFQMTDVVQGDVLYGSAADTLSRLAPGTAGQVLQTQGAGANPVWAADAAGKVLQVVQTSVTANSASTTSTSFVDLTGMTVAITPSAATSKVLVLINLNISVTPTGGYMVNVKLLRDSTDIFIGDQESSNRARSTFVSRTYSNQSVNNMAGQFLDTPSTTSATTYKLQWFTESTATAHLNLANAGSDIAKYGTTSSTITAVEIGA